MTILIDDLLVYAHIDDERDEAVVAFTTTAGGEMLQGVYRQVVEQGFVRVEGQWFDADWERDVVVLKKAD